MAYVSKLIFGVLLSASLSGLAMAAGSGTTSEPPKKPVVTAKELKCKKSEVVKTTWKKGKKIKICVKAKVGVLDDEELYQQGRALAQAGYYDWALDVLALVQNKDDPRVLNYIGYSHRKSGRIDTGISFYARALELNPNFVLAREYLGEGYVAAGRIDLAQVQLKEIGARCGVQCTEYTDLAKVIETAIN
jgi:tetratricopeptide (TPR) repeat protein